MRDPGKRGLSGCERIPWPGKFWTARGAVTKSPKMAKLFRNGSEPATVYRFADGRGSIGVIASVTEPFCDHCNRIRITADGHLRTCLFSLSEHDLKGLLRSGATDDELADFIVAAVWKKEAGHKINTPDFVKPDRSMSAIGG